MLLNKDVLIKNNGHATEANEVNKFSSHVTGVYYSKLSSSLRQTTLDMHMKCVCAEKNFWSSLNQPIQAHHGVAWLSFWDPATSLIQALVQVPSVAGIVTEIPLWLFLGHAFEGITYFVMFGCM